MGTARSGMFLLVGLTMLAWMGSVGMANAQIASGVIVRLDMGQLGSAAELIRAPLTKGPLQDARWVYEIFPNGTPNPAYPPAQPAFVLPLQVALPTAMVDMAQIWVSYPDPATLVDPGQDTDESVDSVVVTKTVFVEAWREWTDSGIAVQAGQRFSIAAEGRWSSHQDQRWIGPEGNVGSTMSERAGHPPVPCAAAPGGALIGRIGGGPGFLVGRGGVFTADRAGNLGFVCNDLFDGAGVQNGGCTYCVMPGGHIANNQGALTVRISPAAP